MIFELRYDGGVKALLRGDVGEEMEERIPKSQTNPKALGRLELGMIEQKESLHDRAW